MLPITSQRSGKFYLSITLGVVFCLIMALMTGGLHGQATSEVGEVIMILMSACLVFGAFYVVIRFYRNAPKITIDESSISFNSSTYYWKDLENIEMTGKRPFKFMGEEKEGVLLKFNGLDERYVFDDMYENISEIKSFIQQVAIDNKSIDLISIAKTNSATHLDGNIFEVKSSTQQVAIDKKSIAIDSITDVDFGDIIDENVIYYKGSQFLCMEGIVLWIFDLFFLYVIVGNIIKYSNYNISWMLIFVGLFYFIFSRRMYYFGLSESQLIIRNHNFFWYKSIYYLNGIKEIVFEQRHNMPVTLRVISNDFTSETYPAATIWGKKWRQLKRDLEGKNIKVRNECVSEDDEPIRFKFFND